MEKKTLLTFIGIFFTTVIVSYFTINLYYNSEETKVIDYWGKNITNQYKTINKDLNELADTTFEGFINRENIKKAFLSRDREKLYQLLKNDYIYLKSIGFKQVHFHLPNNESFLRMHKPEKFGDSLKGIRYSVEYVNRTHKKIVGFENGRVLPGYRYVYPLSYQNQYLGSIELSFGAEKIINEMNYIFDVHAHFLMKKKSFEQKIFKEYINYYDESYENKQYIQIKLDNINHKENNIHTLNFYKTHIRQFSDTITSQMAEGNFFNIPLDFYSGLKEHQHRIITFMPINNIQNNDTFYFIFSSKIPKLKDLEFYKLVTQMIALAFIIGIFVIYWLNLKNKQQDIEIRKNLTDKKNELEMIFNSTKDGLAIIDLESNFIECNEAYLTMLGYTKKELLTKSCISLSIPEDLEKSKSSILQVINEGYITNFEKRCITKNGTVVSVNMSASLLPNKKNIIISAKNVTDLKEKELLLLEQSKLASMGDMIGNIAHQWRQPLSAISISSTGMILKEEMGVLKKEDLIHELEIINDHAQYLSETIETFKNFIKTNKEMQMISIQKIIKEAIHIVHPTLKNHYIRNTY